MLTGEGSHFDNSRDTQSAVGLGNSNVGNAPTTAGPHSSDLANKADPRVDSDLDGSLTAGNTTGAYDTTGPHSSSLLNKLDPRVDSNTSGAMENTASGPHYGCDAAAISGAAAVGEGIHHHRENERDNIGSSGYSGTTPSGTGSAYYGGPTGTAISDVSGPHTTSTANRLDPAINQNTRPIEDAHEHDPVTGGGGFAADEAHGGNRHHLGRDAAVGAGGVGLAEHEHRKHERERETGVGSTKGFGSNTGAYGDNTTATTGAGTTTGPHRSNLLNKLDPRVNSSNTGTMDNSGSDHHYGRDAAVGAGGVGLAEHEHRKHERERETGAGNNTGIGSNTGAYSGDPAYTGTPGSTGHHYGRDAVVGAGGVGLAEHEHRKHERERGAGVGSNTGLDSNTGAYGNDPNYTATTGTTGHHYGRDAAVGAGGVGLAEHEHRKHERERETGVNSNTGLGSTTGAYRDDPSYTGSTDTSGHHYGRDAVIGAGGVGLAEHEHRKHERERDSGLGGSTGTGAATDPSTGPAPNTAGPHSKDWMNKLDPRVKSNPDTADTGLIGTRGTTHGERDAVTGAGLAGAGYEAEKHHAARNEPGYNPTTTGPVNEQSRDHHLGRDAAAAGVIGGTAYEAEKHYKHDKDLSPAEREQKRELKHEQKEEKKHHGILSFLRES